MKALAARRATRRRLAQALLARPGVLVDGASPAPAVVGDLLVGLRRAGAMGISGPRCAGCAKELASFHRRGEHWYCAACGPTTLACAVCGNLRRVAARDRAGRPRCLSCPPDDGPEPITILIKVITAVDPAIGAPAVIVAVEGATSRAGQRRQLAWGSRTGPSCSPAPAPRPPCPRCCASSTRWSKPARRGSCGRPARTAVERSASPRPGTGCGSVAVVRPACGPCPAPGAGRSVNRRPETPTGVLCARTAWSATRPTRRSAWAAVAAEGSTPAARTGRAVRAAGHPSS